MKIETGRFGDALGIPYAKLGTGPKIMLIAVGGPGNQIEPGMMLNMYSKSLKSFRTTYTQYFISRKSNLSPNTTMQDLAKDYADLIESQFGKYVDVFIGISYGGMILTQFASMYPHLAGKIIISMAAHKGSPEGMQLDYEYAKLVAEGKHGKAMAKFAIILTQNPLLLPILRVFSYLMGTFIKPPSSETFKSDIVKEAEIELNYDTSSSIAHLTTPIYVFGGEKDYYFPKSLFIEMAQLSNHVNLSIIKKAGHNAIGKREYIEKLQEIIDDNG